MYSKKTTDSQTSRKPYGVSMGNFLHENQHLSQCWPQASPFAALQSFRMDITKNGWLVKKHVRCINYSWHFIIKFTSTNMQFYQCLNLKSTSGLAFIMADIQCSFGHMDPGPLCCWHQPLSSTYYRMLSIFLEFLRLGPVITWRSSYMELLSSHR